MEEKVKQSESVKEDYLYCFVMLFLIKEDTIPIIKDTYMNIHKYMYSILLHMRYTNINIYSSDENVRGVLTITYDVHFSFFLPTFSFTVSQSGHMSLGMWRLMSLGKLLAQLLLSLLTHLF